MVYSQLSSIRIWVKQHKWISFLAVGFFAAAAWWLWQGRQADKKEIPAVKADRRVLSEGIVFPVRYAQMVMPVDGTVGQILAQEGDRVTEGQPLLRLVRQDYEARVGSAGSDVARATAAVEQARVILLDAERELERQERLEKVGAISKQQLDQARTATERNHAAFAQAQAELITQQARLSEAEGQYNKTELRSPINGTIAYLDVKLGEHAAIGSVLVRIADETSWEVRSDDLTELAIAKIQTGDPVQLTFDGIPGLEIPGKVKFIRPYGEKKRGDITYTVTIAPERWDDRLRWNMTAQIAVSPTRE